MSRKAFIYLETVAFIVAVSVLVHYLGGLDWPWAIVIGAATSDRAALADPRRNCCASEEATADLEVD